MKARNLFLGYVLGQLVLLFCLIVFIYVSHIRIQLNNQQSIITFFIYVALQYVYYKKSYIDFDINTDSITIYGNSLSKMRIIDRSDISGINFIEFNLFFIEIKSVEIILNNGNDRTIKFYCNGIHSNEEYLKIPSFEAIYEYTRRIFPNTIFLEK